MFSKSNVGKFARFVQCQNAPKAIEPDRNLIHLYEAWNKPEKANQWRAKLEQIEDFEE